MKISKIILIFLLLTLNISIWGRNIYDKSLQNKDLTITFLDVGQGDSILIKTPDNKYGLIDTGRGSNINESLYKYIPKNLKQLEFVILTHPDSDHIEGFLEIVDTFEISYIFINKTFKDNSLLTEIEKILKDKNLHTYSLTDINDYKIGAINFDILWPEWSPAWEFDEFERNETGITLIIDYKDFEAFFGADLSTEYEFKALENIENDYSIDLLKLGHHGSNTSTTDELIKKINPKLGVIQLGKNNSYGHPHQVTIDALNNSKIPYFRNDLEGNIYITTDGNYLKLKTENGAKKVIYDLF